MLTPSNDPRSSISAEELPVGFSPGIALGNMVLSREGDRAVRRGPDGAPEVVDIPPHGNIRDEAGQLVRLAEVDTWRGFHLKPDVAIIRTALHPAEKEHSQADRILSKLPKGAFLIQVELNDRGPEIVVRGAEGGRVPELRLASMFGGGLRAERSGEGSAELRLPYSSDGLKAIIEEFAKEVSSVARRCASRITHEVDQFRDCQADFAASMEEDCADLSEHSF